MTARNIKESFKLAMGDQSIIIDPTTQKNTDIVIEKEHDRVLMMAQAVNDLDALKNVVSYAQETIQILANRNLADAVCNSSSINIVDHTPQRIRVLEELRTRAFGKTVVFIDSSGILRAYRIAQANESCIQGNLVIVNRLAPVAGELASAEVGDIITLPKLGDCGVIAVSLVDRFLSGQSYNFQTLSYDDQDLRSEVTPLSNVIDSLQKWRTMIAESIENAELDIEDQALREILPPSTEFLEVTATASLGAQFYTNPTKIQEEIIRRGGHGLLIVQGIAGSGKTSVALGRTKFLCDRRTQPEDDKTWDDFFKPETAIGFVLHSQLVDYLKETRDQLFISDMPVMDYNQLRQKLLLQRAGLLQVKLSRDDNGKYSRCHNAHENNLEGTISLLKIADCAIRDAYIGHLKESLASSLEWDFKELKAEHKAILQQVWETVQQRGIVLAEELAKLPRTSAGYSTEGLAKKVEQFRQSILSLVEQNTLWLSTPISGRWLSPQNFHQALQKLYESGYELGYGSDKNEVNRLLTTEEQLNQLYEIRNDLFLENGQSKLPLDISREDLTVLVKKELLFYERDGRWTKIRHHESIFQEKLTTGKAWIRLKIRSNNWIKISLAPLFGDTTGSNARRRLNEKLRAVFLDSLKLPDLLYKGLNNNLDDYLKRSYNPAQMHITIEGIAQRLNQKNLSDSDIDLFLSIAHLITDGYQGEVSGFNPTRYFSTVFIDEVQDFTELQLFIMGAQADPKRRAVTVVGDFCQQLYSGRINKIDVCFPKATKSELEPLFLNINKRQERVAVLANFSSWFRENVLKETSLSNKQAMRPIQVNKVFTITDAQPETCSNIVYQFLTIVEANHSVAVICPTEDQAMSLEQVLHDSIEALFRKSKYSADNRDLTRPFYVHFTTPRPTKGLEFDVVIAAYFDEYKWQDSIQANAAYVAISRPRKVLHIIGGNLLSGPLGEIMS